MNKLVLAVGLVLSVIIVFGIVSATRSTLNYPGTTTETEINEVTINIEKGWNLVHGFANPEWIISGDISTNNIKAIYAFNPQNQEYVRFFPNSEDNKISKTNFRWDTYISQNSFWVYSNVKGRMTYKTSQFIPLDYVSLFKGWNFVGFTPNIFYDDTFSWNKVKGDCIYEQIYAWNPESNEWISISPDLESFDLNDFLGMGMLVKVLNNCKLVNSDSVTNIPSLPSSSTCTDSDGGADYDTKGNVCLGLECKEDYCEDNNTLREWACDYRNSNQTDVDYASRICPNGCSNGACN